MTQTFQISAQHRAISEQPTTTWPDGDYRRCGHTQVKGRSSPAALEEHTVAQITVELAWTNCPECGIQHSAPKDLLEQRKRTGESIYCPNGHGWHFITGNDDSELGEEELRHALGKAKTEVLQLRHELDQTQARVAELEAGGKAPAEPAGKSTTCPECGREFRGSGYLRRHMTRMHAKATA